MLLYCVSVETVELWAHMSGQTSRLGWKGNFRFRIFAKISRVVFAFAEKAYEKLQILRKFTRQSMKNFCENENWCENFREDEIDTIHFHANANLREKFRENFCKNFRVSFCENDYFWFLKNNFDKPSSTFFRESFAKTFVQTKFREFLRKLAHFSVSRKWK
jgi:hypothetical protein